MKKKSVIIFLLILIFTISLHFGISPLLETLIESNSKQYIGRKIDIEKLKVNIFTGELRIESFSLYEKNDYDTFITFQELKFNIILSKLFSKELAFDYISLKNPNIALLKNNDVFNFSDILEKITQKKEKEVVEEVVKKETTQSKKKKSSLALSVKQFLIESFTITYQDTSSGLEIQEKIDNISYNNIYISNTLNLNMTIEIENQFDVKFSINNTANELSINIELNRLNIAFFNKYLGDYLNLNSINGDFSGAYYINILSDNINISGELLGKNVSVADLENRVIARIPSIDININEIDFKTKKAVISNFNLENPYIYLELNNKSTNFQNLLKNNNKESNNNTSKEKQNENNNRKSYNFKIEEINLSNGNIDFKDLSNENEFKYQLNKINIQIENINNNFTNMDIQASSLLNNENSDLNLHSSINSNKQLNGILELNELNLNDFELYIKKIFNINSFNAIYSGNTEFNISLESEADIVINTQSLLSDFELTDSNSTKIAGFKELGIEIEKFDLKSKEVYIPSIKWSDVYAYSELNNGKFNFQNLLKSNHNNNSTLENSSDINNIENSNKFKYQIDSFTLSNSYFEFMDSTFNNKFDDKFEYVLNNLNIQLDNINNKLENTEIEISTNFNSTNSSLVLSSSSKSTKDFTGSIKLDSLNLSDFTRYSKKFININSVNGIYSGNLKFSSNFDTKFNLKLSGESNLAKFNIVDSKSIKITEIDNLDFNIEQFDLRDRNLIISQFSLDSMNNNIYFLKNGSIMDIFLKNEENINNKNLNKESLNKEATKDEKQTSENTFKYLIKQAKIKNSSTNYVNENYNVPFEYEVSDIDISLNNLTNKKDMKITYNAYVNLNRKGSFNSKGILELGEKVNFNATNSINNLYINDFDSILEKYSPVTFSNGIINFEGDSKIINNKLNFDNSIILKNFKILNEKEDFLDIKIPLNLAISLLENNENEIDLNIPIGGDLDNPKLDIPKLFLSTLRDSFINAAKSPLKFLKLSFSDETDKNAIVKLNYGFNWKSDEFIEQMESLKKILDEKKLIKAKIFLYNNYFKNKEILAIEELINRYKVENSISEDVTIKESNELFLEYVDSLISIEQASMHLGKKCEIILGETSVLNLINKSKESKINYINNLFTNSEKLKIIIVGENETSIEENYPHIKTELYVD